MPKTQATTYPITFYLKNGAFVSDRTVDLNGKVLMFSASGLNNMLRFDPTAGSQSVSFDAFDNTAGGNEAIINVGSSPTESFFQLDAVFNNAAKEAVITGHVDATTSTLDYTADTHTFNGDTVLDDLAGNGAGVVAVDNAGLLSWSAAGGGSFGYPQILLTQVFS